MAKILSGQADTIFIGHVSVPSRMQRCLVQFCACLHVPPGASQKWSIMYPGCHYLELTQTMQRVWSCNNTARAHFTAENPKTWPKQKKAVDPDLQPCYLICDELICVDDFILRGTYTFMFVKGITRFINS